MQEATLPRIWNPFSKFTRLIGCLMVFLAIEQNSSAAYVALAVRNGINTFGSGSYVDSYNSGDPLKSINGKYDPTVAGDDGSVLLLYGFPHTLSLGNNDIYGTVYAANANSIQLGPTGGIGTHSWLTNNTGIEPGYFSNDPELSFPIVSFPYSNGIAAPSGSLAFITETNTNSVNVIHSPTLPPTPDTNQFITSLTTNLTLVTVSDYPGDQPGLTTNLIIFISGTSNYLTTITNCSTNAVNAGTNPPSPDESCPSVSPWPEPTNKHLTNWFYYPFTTTNLTNVVYFFSTNYTYTFPVTVYNYVLNTIVFTYQTNFYDHILSGGDYFDIEPYLGETIITGPSRLVLPNGLPPSGITIAPGGSLQLFIGGTNVNLSAGLIANDPGVPADFVIYCSPSVATLNFIPDNAFTGVIVAPNTDITVKGNSFLQGDFSGAIVANSLTVNGKLHLHGDEALDVTPVLSVPPTIYVDFSPSPLIRGTPSSNTWVMAGSQVMFICWNLQSISSLQWFFNATNPIPNATNSTLSFSNLTTDMAGEYSLMISNPAGTMFSQPEWLSVSTNATATLSSPSVTAAGQFQFAVTGVPGLDYLQQGSSKLVDWNLLWVGASPFTYTDANRPVSGNYFYRAEYYP